MHIYRVVENWAGEPCFGLRCQGGRYHLARALNDAPPPGVKLNGARPHLGFGVLVCAQSGAIFRVIFELINHADLGFGDEWRPSSLGDLHPLDDQTRRAQRSRSTLPNGLPDR